MAGDATMALNYDPFAALPGGPKQRTGRYDPLTGRHVLDPEPNVWTGRYDPVTGRHVLDFDAGSMPSSILNGFGASGGAAPMPSYISPDRAANAIEAAFGLKTGGGAAAMPGMSPPTTDIPPWMKGLAPPSASSDAMQPAGDSAARRAGYTQLDPKFNTPGMPWLLGLGGAPPEISPEVEANAKRIDDEVRAKNPVIGYDRYDPKGARGYNTFSPPAVDIPQGQDPVKRAVRNSAMPTAWANEPAWYAAEKARREASGPKPLSPEEEQDFAAARALLAENPGPIRIGSQGGSGLTPEQAEQMTYRELMAERGKRMSERQAELRADPRYQAMVRAGQYADRTPEDDTPRFNVQNRFKEDPQIAEITRRKGQEDAMRHNEWREYRRVNDGGWKSKDKRMALADAQTDFRNVMQGRQGDAAISEPYWRTQQREAAERMATARMGHEADLEEAKRGASVRENSIGAWINLRTKEIEANEMLTPEEKSKAIGDLANQVGQIGGLNLGTPSLGGINLPNIGSVNLAPNETSGESAPIPQAKVGGHARQIVASAVKRLTAAGKPVTNQSVIMAIPIGDAEKIVGSGGKGDLHAALFEHTGDPNLQKFGRGIFGPDSALSGYRRVWVGDDENFGDGGWATDWWYDPNAIGRQPSKPAASTPPPAMWGQVSPGIMP